MRRLSASRARTAVAVVAAVVAVLAVMGFPGLSFGQATSVQGGSPSAVYTQTNPDTCLSAGSNGGGAMQQFFTLDAESHILVYFTFEWARLGTGEVGHLSMGLDGRPETEVPSEPWRFSGTRKHSDKWDGDVDV